MLAMPFYVMFASFVLCIGAYVKKELRHKEKLEKRRQRGLARRASKYKRPTP